MTGPRKPTEKTTYQLDPMHCSAGFRVRHFTIAYTTGEFGEVNGLLVYDPNNVESSSVQAEISVASITTGNEKRDEHLKSGDFFDVENHPVMKFRSTSVKPSSKGLVVVGELTIRDQTKSVELAFDGPTDEVKDTWGNWRAGAQATTVVNRSDFGISMNQELETGGVMISEEVEITLDLHMTRVEQ